MTTFLIVCPLVFLAGFVDAIAGGGGLISLPAYMFAGIPMHNAIATNKLSSATGTFVSTFRLVKNRHVDWGLVPGTFLLLAFTKLGKMNMEKATGNVKVVNLSSNISALVTFILAGKILWGLGIAASCFSIAGHYVGAGMVVNNGVKIIKPIILVVLVLLLIKVVMGI